MKISVCIVNWNTKDLLNRCLTSIYKTSKNCHFEIIVVDNASTDGSVHMIEENFPNVILIKNRENVGFAKANNQALKLINESKYVLLLNSDAFLQNGSLQELSEFMEKNHKAGCVGPSLRLPDGEYQIIGGFIPSIKTAFNYFFFLSFLFPLTFKGLFITQDRIKKNKKPIETGWIAGACMLVRKNVIDQVGGLDESYFMYAEDAEWCERIKKGGWKIYHLPFVEVIHHQGASSNDTTSIHWLKAMIQYMKIKYGVRKMLLFRLIAACGLGIRFIFYTLFFITTINQKYRKKSRQMLVFTFGALR